MKKIILTIFILLLTGCTSQNIGSLAQCISQSGAIMYGTEWCTHCKDQKDLFGESFKLINYVDCDISRLACIDAGIEGFPTWIFKDGTSASGAQDLDTLADLTNCGGLE